MLSEIGRVVGVEDDGLLVETVNQSACEACSAKAGCGQKLLSQLHSSTLIKAYFSQDQAEQSWAVGDQVELGIEPQALVGAAMMGYMLPLVLMLAGLVVLPLLFAPLFELLQLTNISPDLMHLAGGVLGLICGSMLTRHFSLSTSAKQKFQAKVLSKTIKAANI